MELLLTVGRGCCRCGRRVRGIEVSENFRLKLTQLILDLFELFHFFGDFGTEYIINGGTGGGDGGSGGDCRGR